MDGARASRHGLIRKEDCLLLIIDMQERLFPVMAERERLMDNVVRLAKAAGILGLPVILTEQEKLGETLPEIRRELPAAEAILKTEFDCFASGPIAERIRGLGRRVLIVAGIEAHICVSQTALHGVSDHAVHVVSDGVSSRSPHNRKVALDRMMQGGVTVSSTEMVIYELLGKAGTDTFKQVLKVVK